jgi:hypothetical protein
MAMDKAQTLSSIGFWAFIVGLIIALVAGIFFPGNWIVAVILLILGIIIGFLNITAKETMLFLVATIALIIVGNAFAVITVGDIGKFLGNILSYVAALMAPAAIIVAIKALWAIGKPGE